MTSIHACLNDINIQFSKEKRKTYLSNYLIKMKQMIKRFENVIIF